MRVKITSDGEHRVKVIDLDSGVELLVTRIEWIQEVGKPAECKLVLSAPVELEIETNAEFMCGKVAVEVCLWPDGRILPVCKAHANWASSILRTLGHTYNSRPARLGEVCTQRVQREIE